jgi:toluene monooxygenase system protein E
MGGQKTYWHLLEEKRVPSEYEVVTSKLLYYTGQGFTSKGFELDVPLRDWYRQYQDGSQLKSGAWERFYDPREFTYTSYIERRRTAEIFVDGLLDQIEATDYDRTLSPLALRLLTEVLAPFRYPGHGLQMLAAYIGQMAPGGRVAIVAALQAADELRRVQRIAYRIAQLRMIYPGFAEDSKARWQNAPAWQPLRLAIERLLTSYDWGECFVGVNCVLKPIIDEMFMHHLGAASRQAGDYMLGEILHSLNEDCRWHREWSQALLTLALEDRPENKGVIQHWIDKWYPFAMRAVEVLAPELQTGTVAASEPWFDEVTRDLNQHYRQFLGALALSTPGRPD